MFSLNAQCLARVAITCLVISITLFKPAFAMRIDGASINSSAIAIRPIAGTGSGGSFGPFVRYMNTIPRSFPTVKHREAPPPLRSLINFEPHFRAALIRQRSKDSSVLEPLLSKRLTFSKPQAVSSPFLTPGDTDVAGTTDGNFILTPTAGAITVYDIVGNLISSGSTGAFFCTAPNVLPVCTGGGFAGDNRVVYDPVARRWIITALWVYSSARPAIVVLAVSASNLPTGAWFLYQYPSCGAFDTADGSDQPHIGFNNRWITVTSACGADPKGSGLAVFDKANLYAGNAFTLNSKWFEFLDPLENVGNRDNPVLTYSPTYNDREYLTISTVQNGYAGIIYSYIDGRTDAPLFYPSHAEVLTSFPVTGTLPIATPACSGCLGFLSNEWDHSSGVWEFNNGQPTILTTMVFGDPRYPGSTQIISVAADGSGGGKSTAAQLASGMNGEGPMASEIAMPLSPANTSNVATIGYDASSKFYDPSVKYATWNIDTNTITSSAFFEQGNVSPTGYALTRWTDFLDALVPIPGSSNLLLAGNLASSSYTDQRAIVWGMIVP